MDSLLDLFHLPIADPVLIFSMVLLIILFSPIIFDRLHIPHIVGLILAGVILGPHAFHVLDHDASFTLFGQVGILYIMFLAGIEMDMNDFRRNRLKSTVFGLFTFAVPMLLGILTGFGLIYLIYTQTVGGEAVEWLRGADNRQAFMRYCGLSSVLLASMYASNTLLAYPIVARFGVTRKRSVNITVGGTMITTILSLLTLAIVIECAKGELSPNFWLWFALKTAVFGLVLFWLYPMVARRFFKRYSDPITQYIFVLAMVFLAAFIAKLTGFEYIIGAFLAGITLNSLVPKQSPLMHNINFVGNAIFIPFFLISVGMIVDFRLILSSWITVFTGLVMTLVATLSKYLAAVATRKTFKMSRNEGMMLFGLSNAQAAATLAAVVIGYNIVVGHTATGHPIRMLSEEILNGTIIMILFTCTISSVVTERASRRLAIDDSEDRGRLYVPEFRMLLPLSDTNTMPQLMELSFMMRSKRESQPIYVLHVADMNSHDDRAVIQSEKLLEKAKSLGNGADAKVKKIVRYDLNTASGIFNVVREKNISMVILGIHHPANPSDNLLGPTTESVIRSTNRMVCIYNPAQPLATIKRMVVFVPENAEYESGFRKWVQRVATLARQIEAGLDFYCNKASVPRIKNAVYRLRIGLRPRFFEKTNWDDAAEFSKRIKTNDLLVFVTARKTSMSYTPMLERLSQNIRQLYGTQQSYLILYPEQFKEGEIDRTEDPNKII
ncbi:MAG: cation:proton antiporter [Paludibacteraceae bacterium]|nr:cation:proton antiporter [Paludibacteraceae bacterium]